MKGRASLFLWRLWDLVFIVLGTILSVLLLIYARLMAPLALTAAFAFVSIRMDEQSIYDYLVFAFHFCMSSQQLFYWRPDDR
jgi:hypothetical protein